ncbi:glycosyltransferase family 4 protein [Acinetobacter sp. GXMZU3951]
MKKIIFVINSLRNKSGSERVACILANQLVEKFDYQIKIINRDADFGEVAYYLNNKIKVKKISGSKYHFYKGLKCCIENEKPDKIIVHNMGKLSLLCAFIPNIKDLISLEHVSFVSRPKLVQVLSKLLYKKINMVVTLTNKDKFYFDKIHNNVLTIPNFSPYAVVEKKHISEKTILAVGRLTEQKNFLHLLKAWKKIYKLIPDWKLNIYGEGEHLQLLTDYIEKNSLQNAYLKGVTSNVQKVYEQSAFFVMSSKYEGLPMVLIEAQSFGLPIVSYNCPYGPSDVISSNENGFLVEDQNVQKLADAILELASSPDLLKKFSENSLINAKNYQPDRILEIWEKMVIKR